ncbi:MAG: M48 family metallopeptidase [Proteobacteria bacterium]|nr:M48 family metallopeptidase [Pseudomonadota bacterium]
MTSDNLILSTGEEIPITITVRSDARNIILRPQTMPTRALAITVPRWTSAARVREFIEEKRRWLNRIYAAAPVKTPVRDGDVIVVFGREVLIRHDPAGRYGVKYTAGTGDDKSRTMHVCGGAEFLERRLRDEIKAQFLKQVKKEIAKTPAAFHPKNIAVRDTSSRWGSCSSSGTISFSWRLAFAPPEVMRYVIMHELAHKKHMDHSPKFWRQVSELYGPGVERAKLWLSNHGQELHKYF